MKRILLVWFMAMVFFAAISVFGGAQRIKRWQGTIVDTMINSDNATRLSEKFVLVPPGDEVSGKASYDQMVIGFYVPDMDSIKCTGDVNAVDSVIIRLIAGTGANTDTLATMTKAALPATFTMNVRNFFANDSSRTFDTTLGDSTVGFVKNFIDSTGTWLYNDHFWFSAYVVDSAGSGSGDSLRYTIQWWAKFIENK